MTIDSVRGAPDTPELARPELVQLLTPEGERVEHPDYPWTSAPRTSATCTAIW